MAPNEFMPFARWFLLPVVDHPRVALLTLHDPPAVDIRAGNVVGVPTAVQQNQGLGPGSDGFSQCSRQPGSEQVDLPVGPEAAFLGEIDDLHPGQGKPRRSLGQAVEGQKLAIDGVVPRFQGGGGAAQNHRTSGQLGPSNGDIPSVVARR